MTRRFEVVVLPLEVQRVVDDLVRSAVQYGIDLQAYGGESIEEREAYTVLAFARKWLSELLEDRVEVVDGEELTSVRFC